MRRRRCGQQGQATSDKPPRLNGLRNHGIRIAGPAGRRQQNGSFAQVGGMLHSGSGNYRLRWRPTCVLQQRADTRTNQARSYDSPPHAVIILSRELNLHTLDTTLRSFHLHRTWAGSQRCLGSPERSPHHHPVVCESCTQETGTKHGWLWLPASRPRHPSSGNTGRYQAVPCLKA